MKYKHRKFPIQLVTPDRTWYLGAETAVSLEEENILWSGTEHRAIDDARNMAELFCKVASQIPSLQLN